MRRLYFAFIIGICLSLYSCKSSSPLNKTSLKSLPESYGNQNDSIKPFEISWKEYFTNPTLVSLIDTALANNLDLLAALQHIEMSVAYVKYTKGLSKPYLSAYGAAAQRRFGDYTMDGAGNRTTDITPGQIVPEHLLVKPLYG